MIAFHALVVKEKKPLVPTISAAGVYLSEGRHPIISVFQYSNIPIAERSGAKFQLTINNFSFFICILGHASNLRFL
jgi:hypothetical protein